MKKLKLKKQWKRAYRNVLDLIVERYSTSQACKKLNIDRTDLYNNISAAEKDYLKSMYYVANYAKHLDNYYIINNMI